MNVRFVVTAELSGASITQTEDTEYMPKEYPGPKRTNWFFEEYVECSVCGMWNDPARTPSGGRHHAPSVVLGVDATTGRSYYDLGANDAGQGCPGCGSPAWRTGGRAGDLKREW